MGNFLCGKGGGKQGPIVVDWSSANTTNVIFTQQYTGKLIDETTIIEAQLVDEATIPTAPPPGKSNGGKAEPQVAQAVAQTETLPVAGAVSPDSVKTVIAEKPVVKLTVVISNEDGFKDLYNLLTVSQPQFANIQELTLQPTDEYKDKLVVSVMDATTPGHESFGKQAVGGPGILAEVIAQCGPEACKLRKLTMQDFHMCPAEAEKFASALGNLKDLVYLEMLNVHLTNDTVYPIAETLSKKNPKMKRANFGENGIGAKTKEQMSALFAQTHKGFTLDAYA